MDNVASNRLEYKLYSKIFDTLVSLFEYDVCAEIYALLLQGSFQLMNWLNR